MRMMSTLGQLSSSRRFDFHISGKSHLLPFQIILLLYGRTFLARLPHPLLIWQCRQELKSLNFAAGNIDNQLCMRVRVTGAFWRLRHFFLPDSSTLWFSSVQPLRGLTHRLLIARHFLRHFQERASYLGRKQTIPILQRAQYRRESELRKCSHAYPCCLYDMAMIRFHP